MFHNKQSPITHSGIGDWHAGANSLKLSPILNLSQPCQITPFKLLNFENKIWKPRTFRAAPTPDNYCYRTCRSKTRPTLDPSTPLQAVHAVNSGLAVSRQILLWHRRFDTARQTVKRWRIKVRRQVVRTAHLMSCGHRNLTSRYKSGIRSNNSSSPTNPRMNRPVHNYTNTSSSTADDLTTDHGARRFECSINSTSLSAPDQLVLSFDLFVWFFGCFPIMSLSWSSLGLEYDPPKTFLWPSSIIVQNLVGLGSCSSICIGWRFLQMAGLIILSRHSTWSILAVLRPDRSTSMNKNMIRYSKAVFGHKHKVVTYRFKLLLGNNEICKRIIL